MGEAYNAFDYRAAARRRLPKGLFEFVDRGTEDELALANNRDAFAAIKLRPRVLVDVSRRDAGIELFGQRWPFPVAIAPTGCAGLMWHDGEIALARAAAAAGIPFTLATGSLTSMERVAAEAGGQLWFQLYMWPDKAMSHGLVARALAAGYQALVVTVDTAVPSNREYNFRNGFTIPFKFSRRNIVDVLRHPGWLINVLGRYMRTTGMPRYENYPKEMQGSITARPMGRAMLKTDSLSWSDLEDIRRLWPRTLMIKGVLDPEDAARAVACGVDGVIVSNHGGRMLDGSIAPIQALPAITARLKGEVPVLLDSGVMRGSDVVKALALGASAVLVGRAALFATATAGEAGATRLLGLLREEVVRVMGLTGCPTVADLSPGILQLPPGFAPS
jgi:isopentenyl diphosphate isomerase/L-lactate dehydrogenase-like FMN-dependent dehydrogenase